MATPIQRYVNTDSTPGGDGTTTATIGVNRAYASLNEWESSEQKDLVAADEIHTVTCIGTGVADTTATAIIGWTTDSTRYIIIENQDDPLGIFNTSYYYMSVTDINVLQISEDFTKVRKIQTEISLSAGFSSTRYCFNCPSSYQGVLFDSCIGRAGTIDPTSTASLRGMQLDSNYITNRSGAVNCSMYDLVDSNGSFDGGYYTNTPTGAFFYNCNAYNCGWKGFSLAGDVSVNGFVINCLADSCVSDFSLNANHTFTTCGSGDATGTAGLQNLNFVYEDSANGDFHLTGSSDGLTSGTDLSGDAIYALTTDVKGTARSATPTLGYFEYVAPPVGGGGDSNTGIDISTSIAI